MKKNRFKDIDIVISLSILLVVYGHLFFDESIGPLYQYSRKLIYSFHMPLFIFFSGFLMANSRYKITTITEYYEFLLKKIKKFLPAYVLLSIFYIIADFIIYNNSKVDLGKDIFNMFFVPSKAPAGFLWYIYVLTEYYIISPLLYWLLEKNIYLLLSIGILLQLIDFPILFNLNLFGYYMIFIILSIIANYYLDIYQIIINRFGLFFVFLFLFLLISQLFNSKLILGLISIPSMHFIALLLSKTRFAKLLILIGKNTYYIYLFNTLVMGSIYIVINKYLGIDISYLILFLLFLSGILIPIFLHKFFLIIKRN